MNETRPNPWEAARGIPVIRGNSSVLPPKDLEPGVKYFVLMLEKLGATTHFSCEGHPNGFFIVFEAPYELANRIFERGHFDVSISIKNRWCLHFGHGKEKTITNEQRKIEILRDAAEAWQREFGEV